MEELREQTVLIIGKTGSGKSRLINMILKQKRAESCRSSTSVTKQCNMYKIHDTKNGIIYNFIDTMGLADTDVPNSEIVTKIKDFLRTGVTKLHWIVVTLNGTDRLTSESVDVLKAILEFLQINKNTKQVLFCITHADGWNQKTKDKFTDDLRTHSIFGQLAQYGSLNLLFSGIPDPDEMEDETDKDYAKKKEENARNAFLQEIPFQNGAILEEDIKVWNQMEFDKQVEKAVEEKIEKERSKRGKCMIL